MTYIYILRTVLKIKGQEEKYKTVAEQTRTSSKIRGKIR